MIQSLSVLSVVLCLISASTFANTEITTSQYFFEKYENELRKDERKKIDQYILERYGDITKRQCDFRSEVVEGDYKNGQVKDDVVWRLDKKQILYFGYQETGTLQNDDEVLSKSEKLNSHPTCRKTIKDLHSKWAKFHEQGQYVAYGCVDIHFLDWVHCTQDKFNAFLKEEGVNLNHVEYRNGLCGDGTMAYSFHRRKSERFIAKHYNYKTLKITCGKEMKNPLEVEIIHER